MLPRLRRVGGEALVSAGVLAIVFTALVSFDVRVREQMRAAIQAASPSTVGDLGTRVNEVASALYDAAHTESIEHVPMMIFVVVATVLLLCMLRT